MHVSWNRQENSVHPHAETQFLAKHLLVDVQPNILDASTDSINRYVGTFPTDVSNGELWTLLALNGMLLLEHCRKCENISAEMKLVEHMAKAYEDSPRRP